MLGVGGFVVVVLAYVCCYALTTFAVAPLQRVIMPEVTMFASLLYLPHGVRVLATWAFGWRAVPALALGAALATLLFRPSEELDILEPALMEGILLGAASAFLAFELLRRLGYDLYFGGSMRLNWKGMILVGALSSIFNSVGQTLVFSGQIGLDRLTTTLPIYAIGDLFGLIACMVVLMFVFRAARSYRTARDR